MFKKLLTTLLLLCGILYAGGRGNIYGGLMFTPSENIKIGNNTVKTIPGIGFDTGIVVRCFDTGIIAGIELQGLTSRTKDNSFTGETGVSTFDALGIGGYRFDTLYPVDVYGLYGYEHGKIDSSSGNGTAYGVGIAANVGSTRPILEYIHSNIKIDGFTCHINRVIFALNFISF
jgi:hypothetical protein